MQIEHHMQVVDAKNAFHAWNEYRYTRFLNTLSPGVVENIDLIPLFFHLNHRLLPGFINMNVPAGVYFYKPQKSVIQLARGINSKFRYHQEGIIKKAPIEAIYLQIQLIDNQVKCWVLLSAELNGQELGLVRDKTAKISQWFKARDVNIEFHALRPIDLKEFIPSWSNKSLFLDRFYSEMILLTGKYPAWWLINPQQEKEYSSSLEHIRQARFVDNNEFIDLGDVSDVSRNDLLRQSVHFVQSFKQDAHYCLIQLLLMDQLNNQWPGLDGISIRLKENIYQEEKNIDPEKILADMMHDSFDHSTYHHRISPVRLMSQIKQETRINHNIFDSFIDENYFQTHVVSGLEKVISFLNLSITLKQEIRHLFNNIVTRYSAESDLPETDENLLHICRNMLLFLSDGEDRIPLYNNKDNTEIILDRILIRHETAEDQDRWNLVLQLVDETEKTIQGFTSLLGLLTWCWLNRLVNSSTQVSIDCPSQIVRQVEVRYMLDVLMQNIEPEPISNISFEVFEKEVYPLQSLIFTSFSIEPLSEETEKSVDVSPERVIQFEQLIVDSWGDVYTRKYKSYQGALHCICDWLNQSSKDNMEKPPRLKWFGSGTGDSRDLAQKNDQLYEELEIFFKNQEDGRRFINGFDDEYYVIQTEKNMLKLKSIGNQKSLMDFLELPMEKHIDTGIEKLAFPDRLLKSIYQKNKENIIQMFFMLRNQGFQIWLIDEKGSLWRHFVSSSDVNVFLTHWMFLYQNICNRLSKINYQNRKLPDLEINRLSFNALGEVDFTLMGAEDIHIERSFFDLKVNIQVGSTGDQLNLSCDDKLFSYADYQKNVLPECVNYIKNRLLTDRSRSVYITDIDVPLKSYQVEKRDDIQSTHILKFKRNLEVKINKLLLA